MNPNTAWFIAQLVMLGVNRLQQNGKYDSLTQSEAEAEVARITAQLQTKDSGLPSPQELIQQGERMVDEVGPQPDAE